MTKGVDHSELEHTERALREKTEYLQLSQVITAAANEAANVAEAMQFTLGQVCAYTGWPIGHVYMLDETTGNLAATSLWYLDDERRYKTFRSVTEVTGFAPGVGLPGRVLESGKPAWIVDVTKDANFPRAKVAADAGIKGAFAFPTMVGKEAVAVLEFFSDQSAQPNESLLNFMAQIGTQLGRVIERERAEQQLRESEERYRAVAQSATDAIISMDRQGNIIAWNCGAESLFGYTEDDIIDKSLKMLMPREYRKRHSTALNRVSRGGEHRIIGQTVEVEGLRKDGHRFPVELSISTWTVGGEPFYTGIIRDITKRKQVEQALHDSEERHSLAMQAATEGIYEWNVETNALYLSARAMEIFRFHEVELTAEDWNTRVHPDDFPVYRQAIIDHFQGRTAHMECEYRFRDEVGEYLWLLDRGIATRNEGGHAVRMVGAFSDITERRISEETLREKTEFLSLLQIIASAANEAANVEEAMRIALQQVCAVIGWPLGHVYMLADDESREVVATGYWYPMDKEQFSAFKEVTEGTRWGPTGVGLIGRVLATGKSCWIEDVTKQSDFVRARAATEIDIRAAFAFPVLVGSEVVAVLEFFADEPVEPNEVLLEITGQIGAQLGRVIERERAERKLRDAKDEAEAATGAKSQFLARMSHELRTPLNAIIGISEMLYEEADELGHANFSKPLQRVVSAGRHLLGLIDEILDLSKIEADKIELYLEDFDIRTIVNQTVETMRPAAEKNGNHLRVTCSNHLGSMVADQTRVRQVLINLLSNGCKFTENGEVSVEATRSRSSDGEWLQLTVSDTGIGIAPEQISRLFEEFSQADASTTGKYGGAGLGLAISRHFCRLMGGDISVTSKLGEGTSFTVRLPTTVVPSSET